MPRIDPQRGLELSLQDYYLCNHPSRSGWLSRLGPKEYVERLPRYLGLLDSSYRVTDLGHVLARGLVSGEEVEAFRSVSGTVNPLTLTLAQRVYFLYVLLANDGDFLIPFTQALSETFGAAPFSYLDAGEVLPQVLVTVLERFVGAAYTKAERDQLKQLRRALASIEAAIAGELERHGSGSRREQTTIPRVEWLIDLGLAEKVPSAQTARQYRLTEVGSRFVVAVSAEYEKHLRVNYPDEALQALLDQEYYALAWELYSNAQPKTAPRADAVAYLTPAYRILTGVSGYCAIRPLLLLANAQYIQKGFPVLEYSQALRALEDGYRANPDRLYYTVTRRGTDYQVTIVE
jgi:hypothetical protein